MQNDVIKTIHDRVSLRRYAQKEIQNEDMEKILSSAIAAPTAGNMMLYSIIKISKQETKVRLSHLCDEQAFIGKAPSLLLFVADLQKWYEYFKVSDVEAFAQKRGGHLAPPSEADLMLGLSDALIAAQNAVIAAESLGIGSCYIGDIMENYEEVRDLLKLPKYTFPIALLTLGYYEEGYERVYRKRFDPKYVVFEEQYQDLSREELIDMFASKEEQVKHIVEKKDESLGVNYGQLMYGRKMGAPFFEEMKRSIRVMLKNWSEKA